MHLEQFTKLYVMTRKLHQAVYITIVKFVRDHNSIICAERFLKRVG